MTTDGITVGKYHLRQPTAFDISLMERCGSTGDLDIRDASGNRKSISMDSYYRIYAAAYILTHQGQSLARKSFDIEALVEDIQRWIIDQNFTRKIYHELSGAVLKLHGMWHASTSEDATAAPQTPSVGN